MSAFKFRAWSIKLNTIQSSSFLIIKIYDLSLRLQYVTKQILNAHRNGTNKSMLLIDIVPTLIQIITVLNLWQKKN